MRVKLLLLAMLASLAACSPGPEDTAMLWVQHLYHYHPAIMKYVCESDSKDTAKQMEMGQFINTRSGVKAFSTKDVSVKLLEKTDDTARVQVAGTIYRIFKDGERNAKDVDLTVTLVREDGAWKICSK